MSNPAFTKLNIAMALGMWANYIRTGDVTLEPDRAIAMNKPLKNINDEQMQFSLDLRKLSKEILASDGVMVLPHNAVRQLTDHASLCDEVSDILSGQKEPRVPAADEISGGGIYIKNLLSLKTR